MYSVQHAAARLGVTPRDLRKWLRASGWDHTRGARYEFTRADLDRLEDRYRSSRRDPVSDDVDDSAPGLPAALLRDPAARDRFHTLRAERIRRLDEQVRAAGLSVPRMSERTLLITNRAIGVDA